MMVRGRRIGLLFALIAFLAVQSLEHIGWVGPVDNALLGVCYRVRGPVDHAPEVVIVAVDAASLDELSAGGWRLEAGLYAQLVKRLRQAQAAVIGLDVVSLVGTDWARANPQGVTALAEEMRAAGNVVLPCVLEPRAGLPATDSHAMERFSLGHGTLPVPVELRAGRLALPPTALLDVAAGLGHVNLYPDTDGAIRSIPLVTSADHRLWPSFALETVRVFHGLPPGSAQVSEAAVALGDLSVAVAPGAEMLINYAGGYMHYPYLSARQVLTGDIQKLRAAVEGKIALVGPTARGTASVWRTSIHPVMYGVEINANAVGNLLHGAELKPPAHWVPASVALLVALLLGWAVPALGVAYGLLLSAAAIVGTLALMASLFATGVWMPVAAPVITGAVTAAILITYGGFAADRQRAQAEARLESRLQAIAGVGDLIVSSLNRDQLLTEIVRWVERELDVPAVSIMLLDERKRHLRFEVASGEKGDKVKSFIVEVGHGIAGTVAATGQPLIVQNARSDPRQARDISEAVEFPTDSILCVPMTLHGEVVGVVEALNKRSGPFTSYDQALLSVIANQAALFLENAQLYSELQQRVDAATADLRRVNRDLATQKAKIETLVDQMESGVIATDSRDRVVTWNRAAERLLGVREAKALGQPALAVITHPRLSALFAMPLSPLGGRYSEDVEIQVGEQVCVVRANIALVEDADGSFGKLALLTDITQLKELDQLKTDLLSFASHELANPIASIKGFGELLQRTIPADAPASRFVRLLNHQTVRMQYLVEDFLDVTRIESGIALTLNCEYITDLRQLIQTIVDLQAIVTEEHHFVVEVPDDLPPIYADRRKVEQVMVNLISNAVKYSPDGGEVRVTVRGEGDQVQVSVADEGIGISPDELPNLFQRFRRARQVRERVRGTGIGLFLSRHLVEAQGGHIWAERRERGTVFHFTLPTRPPEEQTVATDAPSPAAQAGTRG